MIFREFKSDDAYHYQCEDVFGTIELESKEQLDAEKLDAVVVAILKSKADEGKITDDISFTFKKAPTWLPEEEPEESPV